MHIDDFSDLTVVIPIRVDSPERLRNLDVVVRRLHELKGACLIVLEADTEPHIAYMEGVRIIFIEDHNPLFHRTKYINILTQHCHTPYLGVWDADIIVPYHQIVLGLSLLRNGSAHMVYPYDGHCAKVSGDLLTEYLANEQEEILTSHTYRLCYVLGRFSLGGAFIVNRLSYVDAGGENEAFVAWGPEDLERCKRWEIFGYCVKRTTGTIFHLDHPIGANSRHYNEEIKLMGLRTLLKICRMKARCKKKL